MFSKATINLLSLFHLTLNPWTPTSAIEWSQWPDEFCVDSIDPMVNGIDLGEFNITNSNKLSFLTIGDWGTIGCNNSACSGQIPKNVVYWIDNKEYNHPISFFLSVGDHFYTNGLDSHTNRRWNTSYEFLFNFTNNTSLNNKYMYSLMGNHGYYRNGINYNLNKSNDTWDNGCTSQMYYTINNPFKRWCMPSYYYTFKYNINNINKSIKFIGIDTDIWVTCFQHPYDCYGKSIPTIKSQWLWLENELKESNKSNDIIIVFAHHPFVSLGQNGIYKEDGICAGAAIFPNQYQINLMNLLEKYKVPIYITGHEHSTQLFVGKSKDKSGSTSGNDGYRMIQIITGSMGKTNGLICGNQSDIDEQYNNNSNVSIEWNMKYAQLNPGWGYISIDDDKIDVILYGENGSVLSGYEYYYQGSGSNNNEKNKDEELVIVIGIVASVVILCVIVGVVVCLVRRRNDKKNMQGYVLQSE